MYVIHVFTAVHSFFFRIPRAGLPFVRKLIRKLIRKHGLNGVPYAVSVAIPGRLWHKLY